MNILRKIDDNKFVKYISLKSRYLKVFSFTPKILYLIFLSTALIFNSKPVFIYACLCILADILIFILKRLIKRARPTLVNSSRIQKITGFYPDKYSFPSAHTFTVFMFLPFIIHYNILWVSIVFIIYALMVGLSRISLKHHYVSDVVSSIILGIVVGNIILLIITNL